MPRGSAAHVGAAVCISVYAGAGARRIRASHAVIRSPSAWRVCTKPLSRHWSDLRGALRVFLQQFFVRRASRENPSSLSLKSRTRTTALTALGCSGRRTKGSIEEVANSGGNFLAVRFESEGARWVQMGLRLWVISPECLGSGWYKERIVLTPDRQQGWLVLSEVSLEVRIKSDIAGVVEQQIELRLLRSRACEIIVIQRAPIRRHGRRICDPVGILKKG